MKSLVLHAKIQQVMRYGQPWGKDELYKQVKNDSEIAGEFMAFSTFERRLRRSDFDYIQCVFVKEVDAWCYIRKEPVFGAGRLIEFIGIIKGVLKWIRSQASTGGKSG